jgi:hypothetical protein
VTALESADHVGPFAQPIDDLSLALVAPLRADDHDICHFRLIVHWARGCPKNRASYSGGDIREETDFSAHCRSIAIRFVPDFHRAARIIARIRGIGR